LRFLRQLVEQRVGWPQNREISSKTRISASAAGVLALISQAGNEEPGARCYIMLHFGGATIRAIREAVARSLGIGDFSRMMDAAAFTGIVKQHCASNRATKRDRFRCLAARRAVKREGERAVSRVLVD